MLLLPLAGALILGHNLTIPDVSKDNLKATIEKLSSWHDRNTSNPTLNEAADWIATEFKKIPGLQVEIMKYQIHAGPRIPADKEVVQVVATLPGATDRRVIVGGHFDSINMVEKGVAGRAPGANDDGSGTALTMELARLMAGQKWNQTMVFVAFSGEEQGLLGSAALAKRAKAEGWKIDAVLSNDMVGNSHNLHGGHDNKHVRVFSEESLPATENPHNSRELARFVEWTTRGKIRNFAPYLVFRRDRFGRGGDHTSFNQQGFTAVRLVEVDEEYTRQHTPNDLPEFVDFDYLANNVRVNYLSLATLAQAADPPTNVRVDRAQGYATTITWRPTPGVHYVVYWRDTTSPVWQGSKEVEEVAKVTIEKINKDDHVFAVAALNGIPQEAK